MINLHEKKNNSNKNEFVHKPWQERADEGHCPWLDFEI